jgi:hypothetical protein
MNILKIISIFTLMNLAACSVVKESTSTLLNTSSSSLFENRDYNKTSMRIYRDGTQNEFQGEVHRFLENKSIGEMTWSTNCDCL